MIKYMTAAALLIMAATAGIAQTAAPASNDAKSAIMTTGPRGVLTGAIRNGHNHPMEEVQVYVYAADSSIAASAYTDEQGMYSTNAIAGGSYFVKIVYPTGKVVVISGVDMKGGATQLDYKADAPQQDAAVSYADIMPKKEDAPKAKKKRP